MFTGFVAIFIFPTVKDGMITHLSAELSNYSFLKALKLLTEEHPYPHAQLRRRAEPAFRV